MQEIPLSSIEPHQNVRLESILESLDDSEQLKSSLISNGQLSPIMVRQHPTKEGKFEIVFGNRRFRAAEELGWKAIKAEIVNVSDVESLLIALSENIDRKDLSDYEKALVLEKIHRRTGKTYAEVAKLVGKSPGFVSLHVAMLHLFPDSLGPDGEKRRVLSALTEKHARTLAKIEDSDERWDTAKLTISAGLSVRELERICSRSAAAKEERSRGNDREEIEALIYSGMKSLNSKDIHRFIETTSSKNFTLFSRFPPFDMMCEDEAKDHLFRIFKQIEELKVTIKRLDIRIFSKSALATLQVNHEFRIFGKNTSTKTRVTIVLTKEAEWKIVHEHWSSANPREFADKISYLQTLAETAR